MPRLERLACLTDDEDEVRWFMSEEGKMDFESECSALDDDGDDGILIFFSFDGDTEDEYIEYIIRSTVGCYLSFMFWFCSM